MNNSDYDIWNVVFLYAICFLIYGVFYGSRLPPARHRCLGEMFSALTIFIIAYNDNRYTLVFIVLSVINIFTTTALLQVSTSQGLMFAYSHAGTVLLFGPVPFVAIFPIVLIVGRFVRMNAPLVKPSIVNMTNSRMRPTTNSFFDHLMNQWSG